MIPEPHELFDIDRGSDKLFMIGTAWIVLFLFPLALPYVQCPAIVL